MSDRESLFVADSCIGGLSVVKSLWRSGVATRSVFLADYQSNPLGIKSDAEIENVARRWIAAAEDQAATLLMACNTLSIRFHNMRQATGDVPTSLKIISMVDCFEAMLDVEQQRLQESRVLIIGTQYTANQDVYPDLLQQHVPGVRVASCAATELERRIARLEAWDVLDPVVIPEDLDAAIKACDFAVLACTCFPMAIEQLQQRYTDVTFLDPGTYCARLFEGGESSETPRMRMMVTGDTVAKSEATGFAERYLSTGPVIQ